MSQNSASRGSAELPSPRARTRSQSLAGSSSSSVIPPKPPPAPGRSTTPSRVTVTVSAAPAKAPLYASFTPGFWGTSLVRKEGSRSTSVETARRSSPAHRAQQLTTSVPFQQVAPLYSQAPPPEQMQQMSVSAFSSTRQMLPHFTQTEAQWRTISITITPDDWTTPQGRFYAAKSGNMILYNDTARNLWDRQAREQGRKDCAKHARVCIGDRLRHIQLTSVAQLQPYNGRTMVVHFQRNGRRAHGDDWTVYFPPVKSLPRDLIHPAYPQGQPSGVPGPAPPRQPVYPATEQPPVLRQRQSTPELPYFRDLTPQEKQNTSNAFAKTRGLWGPRP